LSRGSSPAGYPAEPLVSYQINRQLSGWIPPPLVIRAFGAHCQTQTFGCQDFRSAKKRVSQFISTHEAGPSYVYRKLKLGRSGGEGRQGWRVI
jgi:hypothetical protein